MKKPVFDRVSMEKFIKSNRDCTMFVTQQFNNQIKHICACTSWGDVYEFLLLDKLCDQMLKKNIEYKVVNI